MSAPIPFNKRSYQVFLSHSSKDKLIFTDGLRDWLQRSCNVKVYYDRDAEAAPIAGKVADAIGNSQGAVFVISANSKASGWVEDEYTTIHEEARQHEKGAYRIVGIQLDGSDPIGLLKGSKLIQVQNNALSREDAMLLLESLFGGGDPTGGKPIYFSRGWHERDAPLADVVQCGLNESPLRLVADWPTQESYDDGRIDRLIGSCGALVAVLPSREATKTSKYVVREILAARRFNLPCTVFADPHVERDPNWPFDVIKLPDQLTQAAFHDSYSETLEGVVLDWKPPPLGQHVFIGHSDAGRALLPLERMISRLTGLPVVYGRDLEGTDVPGEIVRYIQEAEFCIIDLTNPYPDASLPDKVNFALNSSIEAGIAMGSGRPVYFTCQGPTRQPPFMFRTAQVRYYQSELELVGWVSQFCTRHRRLVIR